MGRQGPPRPKLITSLLDISIPSLPYAWMAGILSPWGKKITQSFWEVPSCLPFLSSAPITAPFLEVSVLSEQGIGYFLLTFLCKEEADRDQRTISPPTCPSSLIRGI